MGTQRATRTIILGAKSAEKSKKVTPKSDIKNYMKFEPKLDEEMESLEGENVDISFVFIAFL